MLLDVRIFQIFGQETRQKKKVGNIFFAVNHSRINTLYDATTTVYNQQGLLLRCYMNLGQIKHCNSSFSTQISEAADGLNERCFSVSKRTITG